MVAASSGLQVDIELGELQQNVVDVVQEQHQDAHIVVPEREKSKRDALSEHGRVQRSPHLSPVLVPEGVGEANESQGDDVMHHHDSRVLPPCVHVDGGVDGVAVEAALDQVGYGDVCRHCHTTLPV